MRGLPGSGKSKLTEKYQEEGYVVFSRDQARLDNPTFKEYLIIELERSFVRGGHDNIIIDNTHMRKPSLERIVIFCEGNGYMVEVIDMLDLFGSLSEYLEISLDRNSKREGYKRVPDSVIYQMYLQNYGINDNKDGYVIVDVDGTIADLTHRLHYIDTKPKNHDAFYAGVSLDLPMQPVIDIVNDLYKKYNIILVSGRRNQCCGDTVGWLKKYGVSYDALLMRWSDDRRPDIDVKKELYIKCLASRKIIMAIDDRKCILDLWRSLGLFTINVSQRENNNF